MDNYMVKVYDMSFVQDYVESYTKFFDTERKAFDYAEYIMQDFGIAKEYNLSAEVYIKTETKGAYQIFGLYEFDMIENFWAEDGFYYNGDFNYYEVYC